MIKSWLMPKVREDLIMISEFRDMTRRHEDLIMISEFRHE